jgi:hypothetical protein
MKRTIMSVAAASLLLSVGCEEKKSTPPPAPNKTGATTPTVPDAGKAVGDMAAGAKDKAVAGYQKVVDEAKTQVDSWTAKVKDAAPDKQPAMQSALDKAKASLDEAGKKLADFKSNAGADWQKLSSDVGASVDNLKKQLSDAAAQFK